MKVHMQLKLPESDIAALDEISKGGTRSNYIRRLLNEYLFSKDRLVEMLEYQLNDLDKPTNNIQPTTQKATTAVVDYAHIEQLQKLAGMLNMSQDALVRAIIHHHVLKKTHAQSVQSH